MGGARARAYRRSGPVWLLLPGRAGEPDDAEGPDGRSDVAHRGHAAVVGPAVGAARVAADRRVAGVRDPHPDDLDEHDGIGAWRVVERQVARDALHVEGPAGGLALGPLEDRPRGADPGR